MSNFSYMAKPVTVEAFKHKLLESNDTIAMPGWLIPAITKGTIYAQSCVWFCSTRNGPVAINAEDWLIRLDDGEIYPCADEVFKAKYEKVPEVKA